MAFFPKDRLPPDELDTERLLLRPLTVGHVAIDYDAVMASREQLRAWSDTTWPTDDFTLAENRADLQRHQREHKEGVAFTYTVLDLTGNRCLGCVYITPIPESAQPFYPSDEYSARVSFWIRNDELDRSLEAHLLHSLRDWFAREWPFARVVYTVSRRNRRQARLLKKAGLLLRADIPRTDGRSFEFYEEEKIPI